MPLDRLPRLPVQVRQELIRPMLEKAAELGYKPNRLISECVRDCLLEMNYLDAAGPSQMTGSRLNIVVTYRAVTGRSKLRVTFTFRSDYYGKSPETLVEMSRKRLKAFQAKKRLPKLLSGLVATRLTPEAKTRAQQLDTTPNDFVNRCLESCFLAMDSASDYEVAPVVEMYRQLKLKTKTGPFFPEAPEQFHSPAELEEMRKRFLGQVEEGKKISKETKELLSHCEKLAKSKGIPFDGKHRSLVAQAYYDFRTQRPAKGTD
jgi:hypothetical protein